MKERSGMFYEDAPIMNSIDNVVNFNFCFYTMPIQYLNTACQLVHSAGHHCKMCAVAYLLSQFLPDIPACTCVFCGGIVCSKLNKRQR